MQYPPNPYGNTGNNDQTTPYNQPTSWQPGQPPYGQYPPQVPPPSQKPLAHQRFTTWYGRMWRKSKLLTGCLTLIVAFLLCGLCSGISNASHGSNQNADTAQVISPTAAIAPTRAALVIHATPTVKPTVAPTPTPVPPTPTPVPVQPTSPPAPTQAPAPACNGNPAAIVDGVCYSTDSTGGTVASSVPADFCNYFNCVTDFTTANRGYVVECNNGKISHSGGVSGACSRDGGEGPPIYSH